MAVLSLPSTAQAADIFDDVPGDNIFYDDITWLAGVGITRGCNPPVNNRFCPNANVTRGQMAAFLTRALSLPAAKGIDFIDDDGSIFEENIERMAAAGITRGCNPPVNNRFCPNANVTRGQMAAFLHRALGNRLHVKTYLTSIEPVTSYPGLSHSYVKEGNAEIDGRVYTRSLQFVQSSGKLGYREYNLSRDYSMFCSVVGVSDLSGPDASFAVEVFVDGVSKYAQSVSFGETIGVRVPVAGGLRLKLEVRSTGPRATLVWGGPYLATGSCR
jgi:hypothetical protein